MASVIAFIKGFSSLVSIVNTFVAAWITYEDRDITQARDRREQEIIAVTKAVKNATNDIERMALARLLNRI